MKLKHIIILQNKIDLVKEASALTQYEHIKRSVPSGPSGHSIADPGGGENQRGSK